MIVLDASAELEARTALGDFGDLGIVLYGHEPLLARVWELRANLGAYDASYVALAEGLGCPILTTDRKLAAAPGHRADVVTPWTT